MVNHPLFYSEARTDARNLRGRFSFWLQMAYDRGRLKKKGQVSALKIVWRVTHSSLIVQQRASNLASISLRSGNELPIAGRPQSRLDPSPGIGRVPGGRGPLADAMVRLRHISRHRLAR